MSGIILLGVFFTLVFLNVPIAVSLGLSSLIGLYLGDFSFAMFPSIMYTAIGKFALLAIPFFILAGVIMEYAGISTRLIRFASVCVGHRKSGLISVVVIVACFFAAISGSGPATVAALGSVLIPAMVKAGYDKGMATALMSASGGIGIIIPPSIAFVVYASIADVSVSALFSGGIVPGILVGIAYVLAAVYVSRGNANIVRQPKASPGEWWAAFKDALWGLMTPVIILGGIYGGIFTPTEAAGVSVVYGLFVGLFIYKEIRLRDLWTLFVDAAISSGVVMFIIAAASVFAWLLATSHIASDISSAMLGLGFNKIALLLIVNVIFLIAGCFLDANSAYYILIPILMPVVTAMKIDPVHFGVFVTVNMAIGLITPPVGINLYVGCNIAKLPVAEICRKIVPFVVAGVLALLLITYIPQITMFLPGILK
ncbi:TRAP transporter large permease [Fretibacterium sp. OH1220_COT-178]|uniref:TRAP transporter large permease n=1 Tax=Fretibacterium sp. OH1220_COT-178 TaxID=2491047 RepID=UPI000F5DCBAA|nr:TRAP transporter large permease [Fretibacterium sp. OH1220_COT-178]RRD63262.1 TRAP transporter large permease [Fretibacterium sp. OH1220_COT-178]